MNKVAAIIRKGGKCVDCGFDNLTRPEVFEFDHLPGFDKYLAFGQIKRRSQAVREAELEKCDLVCANCHATRGQKRRADES